MAIINNSIVKAVANYTDDALRAVGKANKVRTINIGSQQHTFLTNNRGSLQIVRDTAEPFYHTNLQLNTGDAFVRSVNGNYVLNHQVRIGNMNMDKLPCDEQSISSTENIFKQFLKELLG